MWKWVWLTLFLVSPAFGATESEIAHAIQQLGARKHVEREQAQQFLWNAGDPALPALEKAAQSKDPEISERARALLNDLKFGIRPDTPPEIRTLIQRFHDAEDDDQRQAVVVELFELGDRALPVLAGLAESIPQLERRIAIFQSAIERIAEAVQAIEQADEPTDAQIKSVMDALRLESTIAPEDIGVPLKLITRLTHLHKQKEADEIFEKAFAAQTQICRKSPGSADAHNNLAWLCAVTHRRLDDGLAHAEKAVALAPLLAPYLDTLAEIHFQKGDRKKAMELMDQCLKLDSKTEYYKQQRDRFEKGKPEDPTPEVEMQNE